MTTGKTMLCLFAMAIQASSLVTLAILVIKLSPPERCLSYDEKPLLLFQKLKDAKKNPVFMLKHIKDICSPIVVAQQKHAARKASSTIGAGDAASSKTRTTGAGSRSNLPPKLEVNNFSTAPPMPSGASAQIGWPE